MSRAAHQLKLVDAPLDGLREAQRLFQPEGCAVTQGNVRAVARALVEAVRDERVANGIEQMIQPGAFLRSQLPMRDAIAAAPLNPIQPQHERRAAHIGAHLEQALHVDRMCLQVRQRLMAVAGRPAQTAGLLDQATGGKRLLDLFGGWAAQHRGEENGGLGHYRSGRFFKLTDCIRLSRSSFSLACDCSALRQHQAWDACRIPGGDTAKHLSPISRYVLMARALNPDKLLLSKWTAVAPQNRERHFLVSRLLRDEAERVVGCELEAVLTRRVQCLDWRALQDEAVWQQGWR